MRRCFGITRNLNLCNRSGEWLLFCPEHKKQPLIWLFILIFTIGTGVVNYYDFVNKIFKPQQTSTGSQSVQRNKATGQELDTEGGIMVRQGRDFEKLVALLESCLIPEGAEIKSPDYIVDKVTGASREVDISIRKTIGSIPILIIIECRDRNQVEDVRWVEQVAQKRNDLNASKAVAVSKSGFTKNAITKAHFLNIETRQLNQVTESEVKSWFQAGDLIIYNMRSKISDIDLALDASSIGKNARKKIEKVTRDNIPKFSFDSPIFTSKKDGHKYSLKNIWHLIPKKDVAYQGIPRDGTKVDRRFNIDFPNKNERLRLPLPVGMIDVFKIIIDITLWIDTSSVPISKIYSYRDENNLLLDTIEYKLDIRGKSKRLSIHRKTQLGELILSLRPSG